MNEKRKDHPLWQEFVKWMGVRHGKGLPHSQDDWHCFLTGAEAAFMKGGPYAAAKRKQACDADRLTNAVERLELMISRISGAKLGDRAVGLKLVNRFEAAQSALDGSVERLEELGKRQGVIHPSWTTDAYEQLEMQVGFLQDLANKNDIAVKRLEEFAKKPTPMELSHVANRFNAGIKRLEELDERSEELAVGYNAIADRLSHTAREVDADRQQIGRFISDLESLAKKQENFGNRQGEVTCQMNEHTTSLYNLVRRQEHATKQLEAIAKGLLGLKLVVDEKGGS